MGISLCSLCPLWCSSVLFAPFAVDFGGLPYRLESVQVSKQAGVPEMRVRTRLEAYHTIRAAVFGNRGVSPCDTGV